MWCNHVQSLLKSQTNIVGYNEIDRDMSYCWLTQLPESPSSFYNGSNLTIQFPERDAQMRDVTLIAPYSVQRYLRFPCYLIIRYL